MIKIDFGDKFTQVHLDNILKEYWELVLKAKPNEEIHFMLDNIEWIALEEKTFLFAWFRYLVFNKKKIKIFLHKYNPNYYRDNKEFKKHNQFVDLWGKWKIYSFLYLVENPKIEDYFVDVDSYVNEIVDREIARQNIEKQQEDITIVPFQHISASGYGDINNIDDLITNKIHKPLNLARQVYSVLEEHTKISSKENMLLSKIVTNELFLNVIHHSFENNISNNNECYFAISLKKGISKESIEKREINKLIWERCTLYKENYQEASLKIQKPKATDVKYLYDFYLRNTIPKGYINERSKECLDFFKEPSDKEYSYRNEPFIEFTFLDFGQGIPNSLRQSYDDSISKEKNLIFKELNQYHFNQNSDTRILEYAFLLNSSRHPLDIEYQKEYEIPRGLYFMIDIVRRYNGLVIARSGKGKIIYDFSKDASDIKNAIKYSEIDSILPNFQGTMISIVLPAEQKFSEKRGAAKMPFKLPENVKRKTKHYYPFIDIIENIEKELIKKSSNSPTLQDVYRNLFNKINDIFLKHQQKPSLLIFDCTGFNIFPLKHKLLYYFSTTPYVNEFTSVVLLNFNDMDVLNDVKNSIAYKLNNENNHLYKPIPIINSEEDIHWIGVMNEYDEEILTDLIKYESYNVAKTDLNSPDDYKGNIFNIDKYGNVTLNSSTAFEIKNFVKDEK